MLVKIVRQNKEFRCGTPSALFFFEHLPDHENLNLEKKLADSINEAELADLGIPSNCIPRVTGELPRLYKRGGSEISKIKDAYHHLPSVKRHLIDRALLSLYTPYKPRKDQKIVIFTWVIGDGLGDYFAQLEATKILRAFFPEVPISLVTIIHKVEQALRTRNMLLNTQPISSADGIRSSVKSSALRSKRYSSRLL